jgi:riboflavin synthase
MFTGIVETVQPIKTNTATPEGRQLCIPLGKLAEDAHIGDSICVNGVCLTVSRLEGQGAWFDVMAETAKVSTLDQLKPGMMVNLERALPAMGRFGGHIVQGHTDGIGTIARIECDNSKYLLWIAGGPELMGFMIEKGSVAIDGVSLTIVDVEANRFSVSLIPTTLKDTNLGQRKIGEKVNLEADLISKWIRKRIDDVLGKTGSGAKLTMEKLQKKGFA